MNESRGNRQGNSAFYRASRKNLLEVDICRLNEGLQRTAILGALQTPGLDPDMVDFVKSNHSATGYGPSMFMEQKGFYFTVSSGNWDAAGAIVNQIQYRSGFNHLHTNVLSVSLDNLHSCATHKLIYCISSSPKASRSRPIDATKC